jgi:heme/copper-type cytochrome/quinol oxidase subunit 3
MSAVPDDPIRRRRATVARWTAIAKRTGYLLLLASIATFFVGLAIGFSGAMATLVLIPLLASFVLLAPSIVLGYAVKAAERDDRERGI